MYRLTMLLASLLALLAPGSPAMAAGPCDAPVYHQYDYFVGNWDVFHKNGKRFAHDVVTKEVGGCALLERWNGSKTIGRGYSGYDSGHGMWVQTFFTDDGSVLVLYGQPTKEGLLFTGDGYPKPGAKEKNRVLFRRLANGGVEEYWTTSDDGGVTWKLTFDGFFRRRA